MSIWAFLKFSYIPGIQKVTHTGKPVVCPGQKRPKKSLISHRKETKKIMVVLQSGEDKRLEHREPISGIYTARHLREGHFEYFLRLKMQILCFFLVFFPSSVFPHSSGTFFFFFFPSGTFLGSIFWLLHPEIQCDFSHPTPPHIHTHIHWVTSKTPINFMLKVTEICAYFTQLYDLALKVYSRLSLLQSPLQHLSFTVASQEVRLLIRHFNSVQSLSGV